LTACAAPAATPTPDNGTPTLDGTAWVVTKIAGDPVTEEAPTFVVAADRVGGTTGCNRYNASFSQDGESIAIGDAAVTQMACTDGDVMKQEAAFLANLSKATTVRGTMERITLLSDDGSEIFVMTHSTPPTPAPLTGTTWTLTGIVSQDSVSSPVADTTVTMSINDGRLVGKACNTFRGTVSVNGTTFDVGPLASTRMACPTKEESDQEATVMAILETVTTYSIEGSTLTLSAPDGSGLTFAVVS
jgi:heat shock protein HslJ